MVCSIVRSIKKKCSKAHFHIFSYYPDDDRSVVSSNFVTIHSSTPSALVFIHFTIAFLSMIFRLHHIPGIRQLLPLPIKALAQSQVLIDASGVSFMDGREKFLPFNILCILPALMLGIPIVKAAQGIGPCRKPLNRSISRFLLSRCRKVYARGKISLSHIQELRLPDLVADEASDLAFLFDDKDSLTDENEHFVYGLLSRLGSYKEKIIGICPSSLVYSKSLNTDWDYVSFITDLMKQMTDIGNRILLFPNAVRVNNPDSLRNNDIIVIKHIIDLFKNRYGDSDYIDYVDCNINAASIKKCIEFCYMTIVSRFHAMVFSLSSEIPVLVIGWSHKYQEVLSQFGLDMWSFDYNAHNRHNFLDRVTHLLDEHDNVRSSISNGLFDVKNKSQSQINYVLKHF